jgi:hypothetical protein
MIAAFSLLWSTTAQTVLVAGTRTRIATPKSRVRD